MPVDVPCKQQRSHIRCVFGTHGIATVPTAPRSRPTATVRSKNKPNLSMSKPPITAPMK